MVTDDVIKMPQTNGAQEPPVDQASASQSSAAARPFAAFRLPPFSANEAELWLTQVESACQVSGIVDDTVKFHLLAANLPLDVAAQVRDVVTAKPPSYSALKEALKDRLTQSRAVRLSELLRNQQLGDQRPTQLLLRMRSELGAAGDATQDSQLLRTLFLQRLPQSARAALSLLPEDTPLDQLAMAADRFLASSTASISAVDASASAMAPYATAAPPADGTMAALCSMVASLTAAVSRLETGFRAREQEPDDRRARRAWRPRSRSRSGRHQRERQQHQQDTLCYYHYRFGSDAHNSESPCSWRSGNETA